MLTPNKSIDPVFADKNRQAFASEMDILQKKARNGMFSMAMPLTVGDTSTNYQTYRRDRADVGKVKSIVVNPSKRANETFGPLISNSVNNPYVDPGRYNNQLRRSTSVRSSVQTAHKTPFKNMHGNKSVKSSEYAYVQSEEPKGAKSLAPFVNRNSGFYNKKTTDPFSTLNVIGYKEDPYERKQDIERQEYANQNSKILYKGQPFSQSVRQHGTFYPNFMTYGVNKQFADKSLPVKKPAFFGPFKKGDPAHVGHNKTFGGNGKSTEYDYIEQREEDPVMYRKSAQKPIWRETSQMGKSMMTKSVNDNFRNVNLEKSVIGS